MSESEVRAQPTVRNMVHQLSLNSNGSSETDSNEIREDEEITLDQADAWGFGGRGASQPPQGVCKFFQFINKNISQAGRVSSFLLGFLKGPRASRDYVFDDFRY